MSEFKDGDLSTPILAGVPTITYPMPHEDSTHYLVHQPMAVWAHSYTGVPLDTLHPLAQYNKAYCVADEQHTVDGRLLRFIRVFATLPKTGNYLDTEMVTFPRFTGIPTSYEIRNLGGSTVVIRYTLSEARDRLLQMEAPVRRYREYFIPGKIGGYQTLDDVEIYPEAQPYVDDVFDEADGDYAEWVAKKLEIVVRPTQVERYLGNIWRAQTTFAKAR